MATAIAARIARCEWAPAGDSWLVLAWRADDADAFADALAAVKSIPFRQRRYVPAWRAWKIRPQALTRLASGWPALRDELARLGVAAGDSEYEDTYTPPRLYAPQRVADAFAALQLAPGAPLGLIEAARRYWAKALHPDVSGGDTTEAMKRINVAADMCEAFARQRSRAA